MKLFRCVFVLAAAFPVSAKGDFTPITSSGDWTTFSSKMDSADVCGVQANVGSGKFTLWGGTDRQGVLRLSLFKSDWHKADGFIPVTFFFSNGAAIKLNGTSKDNAISFVVPHETVKPLLHYFTAEDQMTVTFPDGIESPWIINLKGTTPTVLAIAQCIDAVQLILPPPFRAPQLPTSVSPSKNNQSIASNKIQTEPTPSAVEPLKLSPSTALTQSPPEKASTFATDQPSALVPDLKHPNAETGSYGATPVVLATLVLLGCIGSFLLYMQNAEKNRKVEQRNRFMNAIKTEISLQARPLRVSKAQKQLKDQYGTIKREKWVEEMDYFVRTRLTPILSQHGYLDWPDDTMRHALYLVDMTASEVIPDEELLTSEFVSSPESFDPRMHPIDYEIFCATRLQKAGWDTRMTKTTGDQGADVIAVQLNKILVVQCKLYSSPIGNDAVQQAIGAKAFQKADIAAVVSNQPYTRSAKELASISRVYLLHHSELSSFRPKELGITPN